ncbi:MAG: hypothetical protein R3C49_12370 [Planctomycetaceae bacterium]
MTSVSEWCRRKCGISLAGCLLVLSAQTAMAHPGHGDAADSVSFWHYATSPMHAGPVVTVIGVAVLWRSWNRRSVRGGSRLDD